MGIENPENTPIETAEIEETSEKEPVIGQTKDYLAELRQNIDTVRGQDKITIKYDLGDYKHDPELKKLIAERETTVLRLEGTVDAVEHKQKSDKLREYALNAQKIEKYSRFFTPETLKAYKQNKNIITEIANLDLTDKDLKNSKSWQVILSKYGDQVTNSEGALNFILAFMRATDDVILSKIDSVEISSGFSIDLSVRKKSKNENNRTATIEVKLPEGAKELNYSVDINLGIIREIDSEGFWERNKPDRLSLLFQGRDSKVEKMYRDLIDLKKNYPDTFNYYSKYEKTLKILAKQLSVYYTTYGAVLPDASEKLKEYSMILDEQIMKPKDSLAVWTTNSTTKWLSSPDFVSNLNSSSLEPLLGNKGLLISVYDQVFNAGKVSSINNNLFQLLTKILTEYENYHPSKKSSAKIQQYLQNMNNAIID